MGQEPDLELEPDDARAIGHSVSEPSAFAVVFERHFSLLYRFLSARVGEQLAPDLAAETFTVAFRRRADYDLTRPDARPWLLGIAINLIRQQRRGEGRLRRALARLPRERTAEPQEDAAARLDAHASAAALCEILLELPADERDLLLLFGCVGLSYNEIAEALSLPVGTVRSRIHRLRQKLRGRLAVPAQEVSL